MTVLWRAWLAIVLLAVATGGALARLRELTPEGFEARIDLTITDDWPIAQAFVIISAVAPPGGR
mgnify:CR=1 FL=1